MGREYDVQTPSGTVHVVEPELFAKVVNMTTVTQRPVTIESNQARKAMRDQIAGCTNCLLAYMGNGPILPSGPTPNDIMILAEAPTRVDDRARRIAHRGDPSLLLRRLLKRASLDLDDLFFANVVSCWPEDRVKEGITPCHDNLKTMIGACDPLVVLTLGATALGAVSDTKKMTITKNHGVPFQPRAGAFMGRWVFPTWHPAALKKNPGAETALAADLRSFGEFYRGLKDAS